MKNSRVAIAYENSLGGTKLHFASQWWARERNGAAKSSEMFLKRREAIGMQEVAGPANARRFIGVLEQRADASQRMRRFLATERSTNRERVNYGKKRNVEI